MLWSREDCLLTPCADVGDVALSSGWSKGEASTGDTGDVVSANGSRGVVGRLDCRDVLLGAAAYGGGAVAVEDGRGKGSGGGAVTPAAPFWAVGR